MGNAVAAAIAARRTARMPCIDDACHGERELLDQQTRTGFAAERVRCSCGRIWRRIWIGGYA